MSEAISITHWRTRELETPGGRVTCYGIGDSFKKRP